jgi:hypothetical protein
MKGLLISAVLLSSLALAPVAEADPNGLEWRMGRGSEIWYRHPGDRDWRRAPGSARAVHDGWVIGTDRRNGGFGIYRWNGYGWIRTGGAGIEIGGSYNNPWVINDRGERFSWTGYGWREEPNYRRGTDRRDDRNDRGRRGNDRNDDRNNGRRDNDWNNGRRGDGFWDNTGGDFWEHERDDRDGARNRGNDRDR